MDGKTLQQLRGVLLSRWSRFGQASMEVPLHAEGDAGSAELIDIAQALEQMGRDASLKEVERRELLAVERALAKMATGNFGVCEDCGDEIPARRLMVLPEARLCAQCQTFEEKHSKARVA